GRKPEGGDQGAGVRSHTPRPPPPTPEAVPVRLLLIEDNPGDAVIFREKLDASPLDAAVVHAVRLKDALDHLGDGGFDLVLVDLSLPDTDGLETVDRVREAAPHLPLIVLTGLDDAVTAAEAKKRGAVDYLVKWYVDSDSLARYIRYAIEQHRLMGGGMARSGPGRARRGACRDARAGRRRAAGRRGAGHARRARPRRRSAGRGGGRGRGGPARPRARGRPRRHRADGGAGRAPRRQPPRRPRPRPGRRGDAPRAVRRARRRAAGRGPRPRPRPPQRHPRPPPERPA